MHDFLEEHKWRSFCYSSLFCSVCHQVSNQADKLFLAMFIISRRFAHLFKWASSGQCFLTTYNMQLSDNKRQRWKVKWHLWLDMHSPAFKYLRIHASTSDPCRSFILRKMLFFLLLMLLFRCVCHQVSNQADKLVLLESSPDKEKLSPSGSFVLSFATT